MLGVPLGTYLLSHSPDISSGLSGSRCRLTVLPPTSAQNRDQLLFFLSSNCLSPVAALCSPFSLARAQAEGPGSCSPAPHWLQQFASLASAAASPPRAGVPALRPPPRPHSAPEALSHLPGLSKECVPRHTWGPCKSSHLYPLQSDGLEVTHEWPNLRPSPCLISVPYLTL